MVSERVSSVAVSVVGAVMVLGFMYMLFRAEDEQPVKREIPTEGGLGLSKEERELFIPTAEWQTVEDRHICPAGLEYKLDLSNGSKLARIPQ